MLLNSIWTQLNPKKSINAIRLDEFYSTAYQNTKCRLLSSGDDLELIFND